MAESSASRADRVKTKAAVAIAVGLDEEARAVFGSQSSDLIANIDALSEATATVEKGRTGGRFLQGGVDAGVGRAVMNVEKVSDSDRASVLSFLSGVASDGVVATRRGAVRLSVS